LGGLAAKVETLTVNPSNALNLDLSVDEVNTYPPDSSDLAMVVKGKKMISLVGLSMPLLPYFFQSSLRG
jgi:hypothetical protein